MFKGKIRDLTIGVLVGALMTGGVTFAKTAVEKIDVDYADIKVYKDNKLCELKDVNGNMVEPFIYNGTTYMPVRAVAGLAGFDVTWDQETKSVMLWDEMAPVKEVEVTSETPETAVKGLLDNMKSLNFEEAKKYVIDSEKASLDELTSLFTELEAAVTELGLTEEQAERLEVCVYDMMSVILGKITYTIDDVQVDGTEAVVTVTLQVPTTESLENLDANDFLTEEMMMAYLADNGITEEDLANMTEEELMPVLVDMIIYSFEIVADELGDAKLETESTTESVSLELINGKWLITDGADHSRLSFIILRVF